MSTLKPQKIKTGSFKRWIKQSFELWSREPWLFGFIFLFILFLMIFPINEYINITICTFIISIVLIVLALLDKNTFNFVNLFSLFMKKIKDIIFSILFVLSFVVVTMIIQNFSSKPVSSDYNLDFMSVFFDKTPGILENHIFSNVVGFNASLSIVYFILYLYLSELVGFNLFKNFSLSIDAFFLNIIISINFMILAIVSNIFLISVIFFIHDYFNINTCLIIISICESCLSIILITFGYLYAREVFEGRLKNKVTAKVNVAVKDKLILIPSGS